MFKEEIKDISGIIFKKDICYEIKHEFTKDDLTYYTLIAEDGYETRVNDYRKDLFDTIGK